MKKQQDSSEVNVIFESGQGQKSRDRLEVYTPLTPSRVNTFQIVVCSPFKSSQCYSQMKWMRGPLVSRCICTMHMVLLRSIFHSFWTLGSTCSQSMVPHNKKRKPSRKTRWWHKRSPGNEQIIQYIGEFSISEFTQHQYIFPRELQIQILFLLQEGRVLVDTISASALTGPNLNFHRSKFCLHY